MTDKEKLSCLTDRPCSVCKHKSENGCAKWACVFEEESDSADIEKIRTEIKKEYKDEHECMYGDGMRRCLEIIDKYIGGDK